jgi:tRNA dimethylallyltransferase
MNTLPVPYPFFIITGPTAVGKTALTLLLAHKIRGEIINADSVQIYRRLDIGSAKPSRQELEEIPHHLVDILEPYEPFSAADFFRLAWRKADMIRKKGKNVIVSGGTGLYINTFINGLSPCPGRNPAIRKMLEDYREKVGAEEFFGILQKTDPEVSDRLHPNDRYRVIRAMEVYCITGYPISRWWNMQPAVFSARPVRHTSLVITGLMRPRDELYRRIDRRVDNMLEQGLCREVEELLAQGFQPDLKPLQSLGYKQIVMHLSGKMSLDEAVHEIKKETRRYAKRQLTWFRSLPGIRWHHPDRLMEELAV